MMPRPLLGLANLSIALPVVDLSLATDVINNAPAKAAEMITSEGDAKSEFFALGHSQRATTASMTPKGAIDQGEILLANEARRKKKMIVGLLWGEGEGRGGTRAMAPA